MNAFAPVAAARHYFARLRALRNELRTERLIGELPRHIRKDIGWPDLWVGPERPRK